MDGVVYSIWFWANPTVSANIQCVYAGFYSNQAGVTADSTSFMTFSQLSIEAPAWMGQKNPTVTQHPGFVHKTGHHCSMEITACRLYYPLPSCFFLRRWSLLCFIPHAVTTDRMIATNRKHTPAITPAIRGWVANVNKLGGVGYTSIPADHIVTKIINWKGND